MARKNAKRKKRIVDQVPSWLLRFFETGEYLNPDEEGALDVFMLQGDLLTKGDKGKTNEIWERHKGYVLWNWSKSRPGKRPWLWWSLSAPRWGRKFGAWFDSVLPAPRQRLGGVGTPQFECLSVVPSFSFGIPDSFVTKMLFDIFNEDGDFKGVALDFDNPPMFESEASYLQGHGLLTKSEEKRLKDSDFEPESCLKYIKTYDTKL